jgi:hypothetical protein
MVASHLNAIENLAQKLVELGLERFPTGEFGNALHAVGQPYFIRPEVAATPAARIRRRNRF